MVKRRETNRTTLKKRKVYRRKTRGGQPPSHLRGKPLPNPRLPSHLRGKPLPEVPNPSPEYSPIHVSPDPPSPLFRRPSHTPPTSRKPDFLRRTKSAKLQQQLQQLVQQQKRISAILARGSHVLDDADLERSLEPYNVV